MQLIIDERGRDRLRDRSSAQQPGGAAGPAGQVDSNEGEPAATQQG